MIIESQDQFKKLINGDKHVLVDFFATWCMPCRMMSPVLEQVEQKVKDLTIAKLDIDKFDGIAREYNVFSVPTMILFKSGKIVDSIIGYHSVEDIEEFLRRYVG